jgi:hypothetical protein
VDKLDPAVFPDAANTIGKDEQLGRLNVYAQVNALTGAQLQKFLQVSFMVVAASTQCVFPYLS